MRFEFATAARIVFGSGAISEIGPIASSMGSRALVVTGRNPERARQLLDLLRAAGLQAAVFAVDGEPTVQTIRTGIEAGKAAGCDLAKWFEMIHV